MKKYSGLNLIDEDWRTFPMSKLGRFMYKKMNSSRVTITIDIPYNTFLRTQYFCQDVEDIGDVDFSCNDVINLIFTDFLTLHKINPSLKTLYNRLNALEPTELIKDEKKPLLESKEKKEKTVSVKIHILRKDALRAEVMLSDLEELFPDHNFTLEKLIALLLVDFIGKIKKGQNEKTIKEILKYLQSEE